MLLKNLLQSVILSVLMVIILLSGCDEAVVSLQETSTPTPIPPTSTPTPIPATSTYTPVPPTFTPTPTPTPQPSIIGEVAPWDEGDPVNNRQLVLCKLLAVTDKLPASCMLMETSVTTDGEGKFEFYDIPPGSYFILYNSGLVDFESALELWSGERLDLGDADWIVNQFIKPDGDLRCYYPNAIPEGLFLEVAMQSQVNPPEMLRLLNSWSLIYLQCESPFILAQESAKTVDMDWEKNYKDVSKQERDIGIFDIPYRMLEKSVLGSANIPFVLDVAEDNLSEIHLKVMYFDDE